jgi:hypothetical protein
MPTIDDIAPNKKLRNLSRSQVAIALVLVVAVNVALAVWNPLGKYAPERLPTEHSWIWWASQDFLGQKETPAVVILGSSLLQNPLQEQDATFLNRETDSVLDHRSMYLESLLDKQLSGVSQKNIGCFNFAVPGSLMSDNYMVLRTMLNGDRKPKVVVLGLALRDFIDNQVTCAAATPSFKYLSRYTDVSDLVDLAMPNIWQRGEYWLNRRVYLIGKKFDMQAALSQAASKMQRGGSRVGASSSADILDCRLNAFDMSCYVPGVRSDVERHVWMTKPNAEHVFLDNSAEYRRRYRSTNKALFECQKAFLERFCELASASNIRVVIVNMPVTTEHAKLMPAGSYSDYMNCLKAMSARYQAPMLDLNNCGKFTIDDFADTCHMQGRGGKKLLDLIAEELSQDAAIAQAIGVRQPASKVAVFGRTIY